MNRRTWIGAFAGSFLPTLGTASESVLKPLDEAGFRNMVAAHHGNVLLVDFWATWCAPCREEMPKLISLAANRGQNFDLVTISCDEPEQEAAAVEFLNRERAPKPYYIRQAKSDDAFINSIDPAWSGALPALFLFDRTGKQVQSFIGESDIKTVEAAVERVVYRR